MAEDTSVLQDYVQKPIYTEQKVFCCENRENNRAEYSGIKILVANPGLLS